jgi:hypothetical protein
MPLHRGQVEFLVNFDRGGSLGDKDCRRWVTVEG